MTNTYTCRAYRLETYNAMCVIEAESQAEAMEKLKLLEEAGELDFDDHCESEAANELVVEGRQGEAGDLVEDFPENCLYAQAQINAALLSALKIAEEFMAGFEGDALQEGLDEKLAAVRSALAQAEVTP